MWGVGLTMYIIGLLHLLNIGSVKGGNFCLILILCGLGAMWVSP